MLPAPPPTSPAAASAALSPRALAAFSLWQLVLDSSLSTPCQSGPGNDGSGSSSCFWPTWGFEVQSGLRWKSVSVHRCPSWERPPSNPLLQIALLVFLASFPQSLPHPALARLLVQGNFSSCQSQKLFQRWEEQNSWVPLPPHPKTVWLGMLSPSYIP